MPKPDWTIEWEDVIDGKLFRTAEDSFTRIFIVYTDRDTGEERAASASTSDAGEHLMLLERAVRARNPMDADEAQSLADRAAALGPLTRHGFLTVQSEHLLAHRSGSRPAGEIKEGETVQLNRHTEPLYVFGLTRDLEAGTVLLTLGDEHQGERLELELTLLRLEQDVY